tara:strand:+ start:1096 stop:2172 length:1077 start_codon:yes stop_codon:yes gene_type:complete
MKKIKLKMWYKHFWDMIYYARTAWEEHGTEISGYAPVLLENTIRGYPKEQYPIMERPSILKQDCTAATTTLDKQAIADYMSKIYKEMDREDELDIIKEGKLVYCWWHSHHTMKAFWSATDKATIKEFAEKGPMFAIVVNNNAEYEAIYAEPITNKLGITTIQEYEVELVLNGDDDDWKEKRIKEVKELVNVEKVKAVTTKYTNRNYDLPLFKQDEGLPFGFEDDFNMSDIEDMNEEAAKLQRQVDLKNKPVKKIESVTKKLLKDGFETTEDYLTMLEQVIESQIDHYHAGNVEEKDALEQVNKCIEEYNQHSQMLKMHQPAMMRDILTIDDLIIQEGETDEFDYDSISEHIPSTGSLL